MDTVDDLNVADVPVEGRVVHDNEFPNVFMVEPRVQDDGYSFSNRIIIVDLAQQGFVDVDSKMLQFAWWLSFENYCAATRHLLETGFKSLDAELSVSSLHNIFSIIDAFVDFCVLPCDEAILDNNSDIADTLCFGLPCASHDCIISLYRSKTRLGSESNELSMNASSSNNSGNSGMSADDAAFLAMLGIDASTVPDYSNDGNGMNSNGNANNSSNLTNNSNNSLNSPNGAKNGSNRSNIEINELDGCKAGADDMELDVCKDWLNHESKLSSTRQEEDYSYFIDFIGVDFDHDKQNNNNNIKNHKLFHWLSMELPYLCNDLMESIQNNSINNYNGAEQHWKCKLSENKRYLLIIPQNGSDISDVYLTNESRLYWVQSFANFNNNININDNMQDNVIINEKWRKFAKGNDLRRVFGLMECNICDQFKCSLLQFYINCEAGNSQFKLAHLCSPNGKQNQLVVWNLARAGASGDMFGMHKLNSSNSSNTSNNSNNTSNNSKFEANIDNKELRIENSMLFSQYDFSSHGARNNNKNNNKLVRDLTKICVLGGGSELVFCGACVLSLFSVESIESGAIGLIEDKLGRVLKDMIAPGEVKNAFNYYAWLPIEELPFACDANGQQADWIADFTALMQNDILARWVDKSGNPVYAVWKRCHGAGQGTQSTQNTQKWNIVEAGQCNDIWQGRMSKYVQRCYHWTERIQTILLAINLAHKMKMNGMNNGMNNNGDKDGDKEMNGMNGMNGGRK